MEDTLDEKFKNVIARIFQARGYRVTRRPPSREDPFTRTSANAVDMIMTTRNGPTMLVNVEYYRSRQIEIETILLAVYNIDRIRRMTEMEFPQGTGYRSMLVMSANVTLELIQMIQNSYPKVDVWDYSNVLALASNYGNLYNEYNDLIRASSLDTEPRISKLPSPTATEHRQADAEAVILPVEERKRGHELAQKIMTTKSGIKHWINFEKAIDDALQYIFEKDLVAWQRQGNTSDGLSRFDAIARVVSDHDFWKLIANSFRSHYIVFEYKNYAAKIKQSQMYTTEKYLYPTALRSTAIIVSRKGADPNAQAACRGALRETGKLIINLSIEDVCKMLISRDEGRDHNAILVEIVDKMLMTLAR